MYLMFNECILSYGSSLFVLWLMIIVHCCIIVTLSTEAKLQTSASRRILLATGEGHIHAHCTCTLLQTIHSHNNLHLLKIKKLYLMSIEFLEIIKILKKKLKIKK